MKILIQTSLTFIPKGPVDDKQALVHVIALCQTADKPFIIGTNDKLSLDTH